MESNAGDKKIARLYKYRRNNDYTLQMLKNQELYFSFTKDFNDPFDSRIIINCDGSDEDSWRALAEKRNIPEQIRQGALESLKSINFDCNRIKTIYDKHNFKICIICCLSEIRDNVLMWSHYANSHFGICVGFEIESQDNSLFMKIDEHEPRLQHDSLLSFGKLPISRVEYHDECPEPYRIFEDQRRIFEFLKSKAKSWEYEQEYRIILPHGETNKHIIRFDKSILKEVILGCNIQAKFKEQVLELISNEYISNGYNVDVFESHLSDSRYELNIKKIEKW